MHQPDSHIPDFIILTQGRSGSQYLVTLLDSHPAIRCAGEIIGCAPIAPDDPAKELAVAFEHTQAGRAQTDKPLFGFKLPWGCLLKGHRLLLDLMTLGTRCIVLTRQNKLAMYLSQRLAQENYDWSSSRRYAAQTLDIDPDEMIRTFGYYELNDRNMLEATRGWPRVLASYEAMQADPDVHWVQDFLGVPLAPLTATTTRARAGSQRKTIRNYDEVVARLRGTEHERFLDEVGAPEELPIATPATSNA